MGRALPERGIAHGRARQRVVVCTLRAVGTGWARDVLLQPHVRLLRGFSMRSVTEVLDADAVRAAELAFPNIVTIGMKLTETGNAERLVARYRDRIHYCPQRKRWLIWDGKRWAWDERGEIQRLAKATVRSIYEEAAASSDEDQRKCIAKHARDSEKAARRQAMVTLAQSEDGIAVLPN